MSEHLQNSNKEVKLCHIQLQCSLDYLCNGHSHLQGYFVQKKTQIAIDGQNLPKNQGSSINKHRFYLQTRFQETRIKYFRLGIKYHPKRQKGPYMTHKRGRGNQHERKAKNIYIRKDFREKLSERLSDSI